MKKIIIFMLILLLISTTSIFFVTAQEESIDGFAFNILAVDTTITAENGLILTSETALSESGVGWSILIHCEKADNNLYIAKADAVIPTGTIPSISFSPNDIVIAIHSSTSNVAQESEYPNVHQKLAAMQVKAGMYFTLNNIDLTAKTSTNGTAVVSLTDPRGEASEVSEVPEFNDIMGDLVENPGYKLDVTAPEFYNVGETVNVTITMKNIVPTTGIGLIHLYLYYDADKVDPVILNDNSLNAAMESFLVTAPNRNQWEGMSKLEEEQNRYDISFSTTDPAAHAKEDGSFVIVVPFKVKDTATDTIAFQVPHKQTEALDYDMNTIYGNAGMTVLYPAAETDESPVDTSIVETGDSGIIALALIIMTVTSGLTIIIAAKKRNR
ncbi:MAG: hypothetical protein A2Y15_04195 [Clostridiales bacterium GWF2_36_10]|nr:MAG: hypothetical protein A2Y15_04195 [Clostridiales bacterium GWF2_36_10]HAN20523.1 hypothetical protein [Clostridiales bacterium]